MARYGNWDRHLTGKRLEIYKRNLMLDGISGIIFVVAVLFLNNYSQATQMFLLGWGMFIILLIVIAAIIVRFVKKQTVWQLRQEELKIAKSKSEDMLREIGIDINGKK